MMKVAIPSLGSDLDSPVSLRFGRCKYFIFVDTERGQTEALANPAVDDLKDAGVHAARFVAENGAQAVITVMIGLYAQHVLDEAGITIHKLELGNVGMALKRFRTEMLEPLTEVSDRSWAGA